MPKIRKREEERKKQQTARRCSKKETRMKRRHATSLLLPTECTRTAKFPYTNAYQRVINRQHILTTIQTIHIDKPNRGKAPLKNKKERPTPTKYPICSIFASLPYRPFVFLFSFVRVNFRRGTCSIRRHFGEHGHRLPLSSHQDPSTGRQRGH